MAAEMKTILQKYSAYKDSGVDWLGEVPEHWEVKRLKYVFKILKRIAGELGHDVLSITQTGIKVKDTESGEGQLSMDYSKYQLVSRGDFAMNHMDLLTGYVDISKYDGVISPDYRVFELSDLNSFKNYMLLLLQLGYRSKVFYAHGQGVSMLGRWRFPTENFNIFSFPIPPKDEQTAIASFLDRKTTLIDKAIGIKQKQIQLLKERRQIIIHQAVTRGLDPDVKMKDSGVEWIGEVPEGWEVVPMIKYASRVDYRGKTPEKADEGVILVTTKNIKGGKIDYEISKEYVLEKDYKAIMSRGLPSIGDILFTMEAPLGMAAIVDNTEVAIAQRIIKFHFNEKEFDSYYVNQSIQSEYFQKILQREATGSTAQGIKASKLHKLKMIKPPLYEQKEIFSAIETNSQNIATAITLKQQEIEKLKEYKATLINSAVTGKIKVN